MSKLQSSEIIRFPFKEDETSPEDFFLSVQKFFNGISSLQNEIIEKTNSLSKVDLYLHEINSGSLVAKFIKVITIDDEEEGSLNVSQLNGNLLEYSNKVQDIVLSECATRVDKIVEATDIVEISKKIKKVADETKISQEPNYKQPNVVTIAKSIDNIQKSTKVIPSKTAFSFTRDNEPSIKVEKFNCNVDYDLLTALNQKSTREIEEQTLLKNKNCDFFR